MREIGSFPFLYSSREGNNTKTSEKCVTIQVANTLRHTDGSLNVEKLFSLATEDTSIKSSSLHKLFEYPCYLCSKHSRQNSELSHPIHVLKDKGTVHVTVNGGLQKLNSTTETGTDCAIVENVLMIMGKFMKEQVALLLSNSEVMEMCSVWCRIEWSLSHCDPNSWTGSFVAEVYRYCTACCNESSIEELGIKYAIIEMKTKSIATITYLRYASIFIYMVIGVWNATTLWLSESF